MADPFEVWAPREINRLRAKADALEAALKAFNEAHNTSNATPVPIESLVLPEGGHRILKSLSAAQAGSRFKILLDFLMRSPNGRTIDELLEWASVQGHTIDRAVLRSQLWHRMKKGQGVRKEGDRYYFESKGPGASTPSPTA